VGGQSFFFFFFYFSSFSELWEVCSFVGWRFTACWSAPYFHSIYKSLNPLQTWWCVYLQDDGLEVRDMMGLLDMFPNQTLDFFGAIRASTYDSQIRDWIKHDVIEGEIEESNDKLSLLGPRLIKKERLPVFKPAQLTLEGLVVEGERLVQEQEMVNSVRLSGEYMRDTGGGPSILGLKG
jgi:hypothetical protein